MPPVVAGVVSARVVKVVVGVRAAHLIDRRSGGDLRQLGGHGCDTTTGASAMVVRYTPSIGAGAAITARAMRCTPQLELRCTQLGATVTGGAGELRPLQ